jgi:hypothetical protein
VSDGCGKGALAGAGSQERQAGLGVELRFELGFKLGFLPGNRATSVNLVQGLAGAGERVSLGVDQTFDLQGQLDVAAAVKALAGPAFVGLELGKLRLPKAQDVGLELTDAGHISNLEVETVGDRGRVEGALVGKLRGHSDGEEETAIVVETSL